MRHAKAAAASAWDDDHARPLTDVGLQAALRVGQHWREHWLPPQWVWCSDAMRTKQTLAQVQEGLGSTAETHFKKELYMATAGDMLATLQSTPDTIQRVCMVTHNPGTHQLAHMLADDASLDTHDALHHKYPTGTLCVFRVPQTLTAWADLAPASLMLEDMVMPKKLGA